MSFSDYRTFTTSKGVAMDPDVNEATSGRSVPIRLRAIHFSMTKSAR